MAANGSRIGRVVSVSGAQIIALLDDRKSGNGAAEPPAAQIGGLVKMLTPASTVYGMVSGLSIPIPARDENSSEMKIAEFEAIGERLNGANGSAASFRRGVSVFPELGDAVFATTQEDLSHVYARPAVPTIGIGASPSCDGQVLVTEDVAGLFSDFTPRFVKRYAELGEALGAVAQTYAEDVRARRFPGPEHCFGIPKAAASAE